MKISDIKIVKEFTIDFPELGESLKVWANVYAYTPEFEDAAKKIDENKPSKWLVKWILTMVTDWDLLDESGLPYPLNEKAVSKLSTKFLADLISKLTAEMTVGEKKGGTSAAT